MSNRNISFVYNCLGELVEVVVAQKPVGKKWVLTTYTGEEARQFFSQVPHSICATQKTDYRPGEGTVLVISYSNI